MTDDATSPCASCALATQAIDRRHFVHDLALGVVAALFIHGDTRTYPIPAADGAQIDSDAEVILVRWQNVVYAFSLACPHQNTALRWQGDNQRFQCPKHKSKYRPDGTFIEGRATRGMDRFAIKHEGTNVVVDLDALYREDKNAAEWSAALVRLA